MAAGKKPMQAVCRKNDILILEIIDMGNEGEGVARKEGYTLFVKDALEGDVIRGKVVKVGKHFGYVRLLEILTPSPDRIKPECPAARQCGGCQLQHCSYDKQLSWKEKKIAGCLRRIGGQEAATPGELQEQGAALRGERQEGAASRVIMEPILGMENPRYYRNKAQFPVQRNREGRLAAGFYASRTHRIVENRNCMIQHPCNQPLVDAVLRYMEECGVSAYDEAAHRGLVRHILIRVGVYTGQVMLCLVINGDKLPRAERLVENVLACDIQGAEKGQCAEDSRSEETGDMDAVDAPPLRVASICVNHNTEKGNAILGKEISVLYGTDYLEDYIGDIRYHISPLSFFQVNSVQTLKLYNTALEYAALTGTEVVWDLYCGIGTISLFLARQAKKVCGVEIVPRAVEDARENARLNRIENVEFYAGAAEEVVPAQYEESGGALRADVVVLDPPRKGCGQRLLQTVAQMEPSRIVYVSCDPATLARDVKYLCQRGYELKRVRGCDMFGYSYHVETVVQLVNIGAKRAPANADAQR